MTATAEGGGATGVGNASVLYRSGTINMSGKFANGIFASGNSATVITDPGTTIIVSELTGEPLKPGIALDSFGTAAAGHALTATVASTIQMLGPATADPNLRNDRLGIRAFSFADAPISVNYTGPGITTEGGNGIGILALSGGGSITVDFLRADHDEWLRRTRHRRRQRQFPQQRQYDHEQSNTHTGGPIMVTASGAISTQGDEAHGIWAASTTGPVQVNATNVFPPRDSSAPGSTRSAPGFPRPAGGNVTVNIASGGSVMGGWQADLTGVGPTLRSTGRRCYPELDRRHRDPDQ